MSLAWLILIAALLLSASAAPNRGRKEEVQAMTDYLKKYNPGFTPISIVPEAVVGGDENPEELDLEDDPVFTHSVMTFQRMVDLEPTGTLTTETIEKLNEPRCGVPDHIFDPHAPGKYEVFKRWASKRDRNSGLYTLTYSFPKRDTPDDLKFQSFRKGVTLAMCSWELISNIRFKNIGVGKTAADVVISFESGEHGDKWPFDGEGGTLGHAFYPEDGRLHLDIEEQWYEATEKNVDKKKKDIYSVLLHELGHTLGLLHSKERSAVMQAFYRYRGTFGSLVMPVDEIAGMEDMYEKRIDSNPVDEPYSACLEAKRKRYHHNFTIPARPTTAPKVAVLEEKPCDDLPGKERQCPFWKARNYCELHASTLLTLCPKTCGFCPGDRPLEKIEEDYRRPSELVTSICDIREFDSVVTTYDNDDGFMSFIFKDDYFFRSDLSLLPEKYSTLSLFNKTEELKGAYSWGTDPKSIPPKLFKTASSTFMPKTKKVDASLVSGRRYFVFEDKNVHIYKIDMGLLTFEKTHDVAMLFPGYPNSLVDAAHSMTDEFEDSVTYTLFYESRMWQYKEFRDNGRSNLLFLPVEDKTDVDISEWYGVPACNIDSVFEYRGIPYFLKGNIFWPAIHSEPQIPRDITYSLFRCWQKEPENMLIPTSCERRANIRLQNNRFDESTPTTEDPGNSAGSIRFKSMLLVSLTALLNQIIVKHIL